MKISIRWLKEILPGLKRVSPQKIADRLTKVGFEIESMEDKGDNLKGVVVGQVLEVSKHPNADRLSVCKVTDGRAVIQVVCGAANVASRKKYPLALSGASLPHGLLLKNTTIRGVESFGMLCSSKELALEDDVAGIYELEETARVGQSIANYLGDTVLDIAVPPNRGDLLSHRGIACEVGALFKISNKPLNEYPLKKWTGSFPFNQFIKKIKVEEKKGCPRYTSLVIRGVTMAPSPFWLKRRLTNLGIRPINNVVDATNYIMMETGHPLHAFDHRFLKNGQLKIRRAKSGEKLITLDQVERLLKPDDLVIADDESPIALAGIMGGFQSQIREDTTVLVLEAASFDPQKIRRTSKRLGLRTESSFRFERFVSPTTVFSALDRLSRLILSLAGGENSSDYYDSAPRKAPQGKVFLRLDRLKEIVGVPFKAHEVLSILNGLGFSVQTRGRTFHVAIPHFRNDLSREIDLIEEVVRFYGFEKIPSQIPVSSHRVIRESVGSQKENKVRAFFAANGFTETIHYSFCSEEELKKTGLKGPFLSLKNPLSPELSIMRPSLLPGLMNSLKNNQGSLLEGVRFFEMRPVYYEESLTGGQKRVLERIKVAGIYGGGLFPGHWSHFQRESDFFFGKGLCEKFFLEMRLPQIQWKPQTMRNEFHPLQCLEILLGETSLGFFGKIHPEILKQWDIKTGLSSPSLYAFDLDFSVMEQFLGVKPVVYKTRSPYPAISRDLALVMDKSLSHEVLLSAIQSLKVPCLKEISLFDFYEGEKIPPGKISLAFSLIYESRDKTLTDDEVNTLHFGLVNEISKKLNVSLRAES